MSCAPGLRGFTASRPDLPPITTEALADSGALMLCSPEARAMALKLELQSGRELTVADGRMMRVPCIGSVKVAFQDRLCFVGGLVLGDDVLPGEVPLEDMDLTIHPSRQQLEPDPRHPGTPHVLVKRVADATQA